MVTRTSDDGCVAGKSTRTTKIWGSRCTSDARIAKHDSHKKRAHTTAKKDVRDDKLEAQQEDTPKVYWGREKVQDF